MNPLRYTKKRGKADYPVFKGVDMMAQQTVDATKQAAADNNLVGGAVADPAALKGIIDDLAAKINNNANDAASKAPTTAAWIAPTLQNGWVNIGTPYGDVGYYKDDLGIVHLRGAIKSGIVQDAAVIFNLPAGFRPSKQTIHSTIGSNATTGTASVRVDIRPAGTVELYAVSNNFVSFDGLTFRAEQ